MKLPKSKPTPVWAQKGGIYLIAVILLAIAVADWIWPWEPGQTYLSEKYSSSFRYCVSIVGSDSGVEKRGYILVPECFTGASIIYVESKNGEIQTRSSRALFFLFLILHAAVFTSAWLQLSADSRCLKTGLSVNSGAKLMAIRNEFVRSWSGEVESRQFSTDAALLGVYLLLIAVLMFAGHGLIWWVQVLLGLTVAFALVLVGIINRRKHQYHWAGVHTSNLGIALLSAAIGVAFGYSALEASDFNQALTPYLLFLFGIFGFNILEHLGLASMHDPESLGSIDDHLE